MLDDHMKITDGEESHSLHMDVSGTAPLPLRFQFWMAEIARDMLRLGIYFRAVGIMLQIPGAGEYESIGDENETWDLIQTSDRDVVVNALSECLDRLGAAELIKQVSGGASVGKQLPRAWKELLDRRQKVKNGLLNVAADCLDELVVKPGMAEIAEAGKQPWWERWRAEK